MGRTRGVEVVAIAGVVALAAWTCGPDGPELGGDTGGNGGGDTGRMVDAGDADDDDSNGSGDYTGEVESDLDDETEVEGLSEDDQYELCRAGVEFVEENLALDDVCLWAAHTQANSPEYEDDEAASGACETARTQWEENRDPEYDPCDGIAGGESCAATVAGWEQCEQALSIEFFDHIEELPSCSETTAAFYADDYQSYPPPNRDASDLPESCRPFRRNCLDFFRNWVGPVKGR